MGSSRRKKTLRKRGKVRQKIDSKVETSVVKTDSKVETSVVTKTSLEFKTTQTPKRTFGNDWRRKLVSKDERVARVRNRGYRRRKSYDRKEQDPLDSQTSSNRKGSAYEILEKKGMTFENLLLEDLNIEA